MRADSSPQESPAATPDPAGVQKRLVVAQHLRAAGKAAREFADDLPAKLEYRGGDYVFRSSDGPRDQAAEMAVMQVHMPLYTVFSEIEAALRAMPIRNSVGGELPPQTIGAWAVCGQWSAEGEWREPARKIMDLGFIVWQRYRDYGKNRRVGDEWERAPIPEGAVKWATAISGRLTQFATELDSQPASNGQSIEAKPPAKTAKSDASPRPGWFSHSGAAKALLAAFSRAHQKMSLRQAKSAVSSAMRNKTPPFVFQGSQQGREIEGISFLAWVQKRCDQFMDKESK